MSELQLFQNSTWGGIEFLPSIFHKVLFEAMRGCDIWT